MYLYNWYQRVILFSSPLGLVGHPIHFQLLPKTQNNVGIAHLLDLLCGTVPQDIRKFTDSSKFTLKINLSEITF